MTREDPAPVGVIRVVIVDDQEMFAESVARVLDRVDDIEVVEVARTCAQAVDVARRSLPDVAIVDYHLPDGDGASLAPRLGEVSPATRVVLLTGLLDDRIALAAVEGGCAGFLTKDKAVDELVDAVRAVQSGEVYMPPAVLKELLPRLRSTFRPVGSSLTAREREVLQMLADGMSNDAIARRLVLSRHTIRNHVQNLLTKLNAHSKLEAVAVAVREGLVARSGG